MYFIKLIINLQLEVIRFLCVCLAYFAALR